MGTSKTRHQEIKVGDVFRNTYRNYYKVVTAPEHDDGTLVRVRVYPNPPYTEYVYDGHMTMMTILRNLSLGTLIRRTDADLATFILTKGKICK